MGVQCEIDWVEMLLVEHDTSTLLTTRVPSTRSASACLCACLCTTMTWNWQVLSVDWWYLTYGQHALQFFILKEETAAVKLGLLIKPTKGKLWPFNLLFAFSSGVWTFACNSTNMIRAQKLKVDKLCTSESLNLRFDWKVVLNRENR